MKDTLKHLPWPLIIILALIAFTRPAIRTIGHFAGFSVDPTMIWAMIFLTSIVWLGIVLALRVAKPVYVLGAAGALYAWISIFVALIIQTIAPGSGEDPPTIAVLLTAGLVSTTIINVLAGVGLGVVAGFLQRVLNRQPKRSKLQ